MNRLILLAAAMALLASCSTGGGSATLAQPGNAREAIVQPDSSALPALDEMDATQRNASIAGPGWQPIDILGPATASLSSNATVAGNAVDFDSGTGLAWRVFGIGDFHDDFRPTSLDVDVTETDVPYFIAHADYVTGRWQVDGPFEGDTTHEYTSVNEYSDPAALVSPFGIHYVAIILPQGNFLQLDALSLGILAGDDVPLPVVEFQQNGGPDSIIIQWLDSPSALDADFDGYIVQRSPFLSLDWQDLHEDTRRSRTYVDDTALPATIYRYRINTHDLAGNVAYGLPVYLQTIPGNVPPVAIVDVARGPHFGPVDLRFDMSASYDPEGDPITGYTFEFGPHVEPVSQPGPVLDITLQPGNYIVYCTVETGVSSSTDYVPLVVYPQWEDTPHLIDDGTESVQRYYFPFSVTEADGSATTTFFFDALIPGIGAASIDADGVVSRAFHSAPLDGFHFLTEPVRYDDGWAFVAVTDGTALIYLWDGEQLELLQGFARRIDGGSCQLVTDEASGLYFIYFDQIGPGDWNLVWRDLVTGTDVILQSALTAPLDFDCDWNESAGAFDAVYVSTELRWSRFLPGMPMGSAMISADTPVSLEIDIDPATGRPGLVYFHADKVHYSSLNADLTTWTTPEPVELTANHGVNPQLLHADGNAYVAISIPSTGKVQVLENSGSGWTSWNVHDDAGLNDFINIAKLPGEDGLRLLSQHSDNSTRIFSMRSDDSQELFVKLAAAWGSGLKLTAASSSSSMHVMQQVSGDLIHFLSSDGRSWSPAAVPGTTPGEFELGGSTDGELRLAWTDGTDIHLDLWDGSAFVNVTSGSRSGDCRPLLSDEGPYRLGWEDIGGADFQAYQQSTGLISHAMAGMPVWDGSLIGDDGVVRPLVFYGGSDFEDAEIGYVNIGTNKIDHIADVDSATMTYALARGRGMDGASYLDLQLLNTVNVWHVCTGPEAIPIRVVRRPGGFFESENLPFSSIDFGYPDLRRVSSAVQAPGGTFVGLTSANLMSEYHFEWSRFGEFEELPLPQVDNMSLPELLIGPDGRWHIVFRDYVDDNLMVISTI